MQPRIRPATRDDLPEMIELARRSWLSAFAQTAPFELIAWWAGSDRTRQLYEAEWHEMHVLDEGGGLAGLVQAKLDEINGLWVHPRRQRRGLGAQLLAHGEQLVRAAGHRRVWLTCDAVNAGALSFYRARGYVETARHRAVHRCGVAVEDVRLERSLDASQIA